MTGTEYVIDKLGQTCDYLERALADRDAQIVQLTERIAQLEPER